MEKQPSPNKLGIVSFLGNAYWNLRRWQIYSLIEQLPPTFRSPENKRLVIEGGKDQAGNLYAKAERPETPLAAGEVIEIEIMRAEALSSFRTIDGVKASVTAIRNEDIQEPRRYNTFTAEPNTMSLGEVVGALKMLTSQVKKP